MSAGSPATGPEPQVDRLEAGPAAIDAPPGGISLRVAEAVTALLLGGVAAIAIVDAQRLGIGWSDDGPRAGYFPFWLAVLLGIASLGNLIAAFRPSQTPKGAVFVTWGQARLVGAVLLPSIVFVAGVLTIGLYVSSVLLIVWFMIVLGRFSPLRAIPLALLVVAVIFVTFEFWFLVSLPKGPLEAALGF